MQVIQLAGFALEFTLVPLLLGGHLWGGSEEHRTDLGLVYVTGLIVMFALFEALALPAIAFFRQRFDLLVLLYGGATLLLALAGVIRFPHLLPDLFLAAVGSLKNLTLADLLLFLLVAAQAVFVVYFQHVDDDDSFFIGTAETTLQTNTMYVYDANNGSLYSMLPERYVLSPFPVFIAFLSTLSGLHPALIAHTVFPALFIPAVYLVFYLFGRELFKKRKGAAALFGIFLSVLLLFSGFSRHSLGSMLFLRIWQGKALIACLILPFLFLLLYLTLAKAGEKPAWPAVFLTAAASCMVSSMGIILGAIVIGVYGFLYTVLRRDLKVLGCAILCALPNIVCAAAYLYLVNFR